MENALWNGQKLIAAEVAKKSYEYEKSVRMASARGELQCPDAECRHRRLCYRNGEKVSAYVAHCELEDGSCDYAAFDRENTGIIRKTAQRLYHHFREMGYAVCPEVKLLPHHYTHLVLENCEGIKIALELGSKHMRAPELDYFLKEYQALHMPVQWFFVGNPNTIFQEKQTYFLKRSLLYESENQSLLVIEPDGEQITQFKQDLSDYYFEEALMVSDHDMFIMQGTIADLIVEDTNIVLKGFTQHYEEYLDEGQQKYMASVNKILEQRQQLQKQNAQLNPRNAYIVSMANTEGNIIHQIITADNPAVAFQASMEIIKETGNTFLDVQSRLEWKPRVYDCKSFSFSGKDGQIDLQCGLCGALGSSIGKCKPAYKRRPENCSMYAPWKV